MRPCLGRNSIKVRRPAKWGQRLVRWVIRQIYRGQEQAGAGKRGGRTVWVIRLPARSVSVRAPPSTKRVLSSPSSASWLYLGTAAAAVAAAAVMLMATGTTAAELGTRRDQRQRRVAAEKGSLHQLMEMARDGLAHCCSSA